MPLVARLGSGIPLVARGREMARLRASLALAASGTASAVLLAGDAGVGKTRVVDELAAEADALVLTGRCLDVGEIGIPYLPFAEVLGQVRDRGLLDIAARPALARLLPELALPVGHDEARESSNQPPLFPQGRRSEQDVGQLQLFDAVHGLLGDLAEQRTVLLVVEDLHWADASTRYLLSFLLSRLRSQRLLIVGTYRSDDLHRAHPLRPLLTELLRLPVVERVALGPFGAEESRRFVDALADELPEDLVREVSERSEGNPFFAEELIAAASCLPSGGIPSTLVDVLLTRIERLAPSTQHVVRVASVGGRRVSHDRLRTVAGLDDVVLDAALREAVQHHVLLVGEGDEIYVFRHALLQEAVHGDLLPGERVRLHAAYARYLTGRTGRGFAAGLAYHSLESHDLPRALAASVDAGQEAHNTGAPAEALRHFEQALKLWQAVPEDQRPSDVTELTLLSRASWSAGTAGQPERALAFARSATRVVDPDDPEKAAEMWRRVAQASQGLDGHDKEMYEAVDQAWQLVRDRPASRSRAWVLAVSASCLRYARDLPLARERAEMAVQDGRASGAAGAVADALATLGLLDDSDNRIESAREHLTGAIDCAVEADAVNTELRARYFLGLHHYDRGELADALRVFQAASERAKGKGMTWSGFGLEVRVLLALTLYHVGRWDESAEAAEPPGLAVSSTVTARLAAVGTHVVVSRGEFDQAERLIGELRKDWHRDLQIALITGGTGAELAHWRGRPDQAVERVADTIDWTHKLDGEWLLAGIRLGALGIAGNADLAAHARRRRDKTGEANAVAEGHRLADYARDTAVKGLPRTGVLGPEGRAWLARAEAEESRLAGAGDPELWTKAVAEFGFGAVFEQAVCRWRLAEALLSADRRDDAAAHLREVGEFARELRAAPLLDAVTQSARRARIALRADEAEPRDHVDPFTPRERSVLGLVALGRTNREVGEELYISEKTVSVHLTRIMAKLGAGRRAEAVAIAYDRGLLDPS
jgi:DNA-binding CsgD family transcriptional regulator/tetratricopeptide (TPR) repeat protein